MSAPLFGRKASRWLSGPRPKARCRARHPRRLTVEPLEGRVLLDASGLPGDSIGDVTLDDFSRFESAAELREYLIDDALQRYDDLFGQPGPRYYPQPWEYYRADLVIGLGGAVTRSTTNDVLWTQLADSDGSYSETNTQVAGVDEGDIVETDGEYLYVLSGQEIVIIDALPAEELEVVSRIQIAGQPFEQYLNGDRLTVLSRAGGDYWGGIESERLTTTGDWAPQPGDPTVTVTVLDVSDREAPAIVQQTALDGNFVDSRTIGDYVYLVLNNGFYLPAPELVAVAEPFELHTDPPSTENLIDVGPFTLAVDLMYWPRMPLYPDDGLVYETQEEYLTRIEGQVLDLALPHYAGYDAGGELIELGLISGATDIYRPLGEDNENLTSVVVIDMAAERPGPASSVSVPMQWTSQIYMSTEAMYVLRTDHGYDGEATTIMKFALDETGRSIDLAAVGGVPGHVLNQFSIDEYEGYLRIATTEGWAGRWIAGVNDGNMDDLSRNNLFVLQQEGEALEIVGSVEGLAPNEKIYSARFMGDRAFVVTYRKVDPLFAIDLSDPTSPYVAGELKVPGFSNYLHPVEGGYLIGIGRDAQVSTGLFQDPQVSLFDVNDLTDPQLADRYTIPTGRAGGQNIFDDHHVIAYFPEYKVLTVAVPDSGRRDTDMWVFRVDPEVGPGGDKVEFLGKIEHDLGVRRSVRIGEKLYTVSDDMVAVNELLNPEVEIDRIRYKATDLGWIERVGIDDAELYSGDGWYRFQTPRPGLLTLETVGDGQVAAELFDGNSRSLGLLEAGRGDWEVEAGDMFSLRVSDAPADSKLQVSNLFERDGDEVTIHGTSSNDRFELNLTTMVATLGETEYPLDGDIRSITFNGLGGADVVLSGTEADESAELWSGHGTLQSGDLTVNVNGAKTITVYGGGGDDSAVLHDSAGDDRIVQWPGGSMLSGSSFTNKVHRFSTVYARSTAGGRDTGKVYDSLGDDELLTKPGFSRLSGDGFLVQAEGFYTMHAFSTAGGTDVAKMYDSPGNDTFGANSIGAALFGVLPGGGAFYNRAKFFEGVHAYATAGGVDLAKLFDSPGDDTFRAGPIQGALFGVLPGGGAFYNRAKFFEGVHAYATAGGHDIARLLDSAEDDIFYATRDHGALYRPGHFYNRAKHFEEVYAEAGAGGDDEARLNDSALGDLLEADGKWARLSNADLDFLYQASAFQRVKATATDAAGTRAIGPKLDFVLEQIGSWVDR